MKMQLPQQITVDRIVWDSPVYNETIGVGLFTNWLDDLNLHPVRRSVIEEESNTNPILQRYAFMKSDHYDMLDVSVNGQRFLAQTYTYQDTPEAHIAYRHTGKPREGQTACVSRGVARRYGVDVGDTITLHGTVPIREEKKLEGNLLQKIDQMKDNDDGPYVSNCHGTVFYLLGLNNSDTASELHGENSVAATFENHFDRVSEATPGVVAATKVTKHWLHKEEFAHSGILFEQNGKLHVAHRLGEDGKFKTHSFNYALKTEWYQLKGEGFEKELLFFKPRFEL